ncbi:hypothetical protein COV19_00900 [Candidatus Woesearchaeota archaeon CG10_big_fil_rev_8_21_14_0_10_44_13]|nr:MAG: hypothetical protein COV19_00900 [Candidatus Woesearchaeota archaeon CG10_big_fil_rev_8_21_14_0_10_44_13]
MKLQTHLIATSLLFMGLYPHYRHMALLVFVGGFFIDMDHYFYYIMKTKDLNLKKAYHFCENKTYSDVFCIFHHFEFIAILFLIGFFSSYVMLVSIGASVHFAMDIIHIAVSRRISREISDMSWIARLVKKIKS